jgi:hypothetical protein
VATDPVVTRFSAEVVVPFASGVTGVALKLQVIAALPVAQARATGLLNPPSEETVTVDELLFPAMIVAEEGVVDRLKSLTLRVSDALWLSVLELPATVST